MSEHTPGPWTLGGTTKENRLMPDTSIFAGGVLVANTAGFSSNGDGHELLPERQKADARLIAAAPDMFRILKELLMPCPPEYAKAVEQRIKALIKRVES